jgi:tRNA(adenine34) deaminase
MQQIAGGTLKFEAIRKMFSELDNKWMELALDTARQALEYNEVPVGAVIVDADGKLLAAASNRPITDSDPTAHAEVLAIREAAKKIGNDRVTGCTLYATIEPCAMCAGALVNARIKRLVYGTRDERFGAVDTHFHVCTSPDLNHRIEVTAGVMADECRQLIQAFFKTKRAG